MLRFKFDFHKTVQAAGVLLRHHGKRLEYLRLLKLLYIADREQLLATGYPITGDQAVAMKNGPVLTRVYDLIKQKDILAGDWDACVHKDGHQVSLVADPGTGALSRGEIDKLVEVAERYHDTDTWELVDVTHQFPEWKENYRENTATRYAWDDVLKAGGRQAVIPVVEKDLAARAALDALFGG